MPDVRHQHDAVSCRDTEQCNEADHRRDAQHAAGEKHAGHAADERQRQVHHHEHGIASAAECQDQQHEQPCDDGDEQDAEPLGGALLAFKLPAVLDAIARRHRHRLRDLPPYVVDDAAEIAAGDVRRDDNPPLDVLAQDHVRPLLAAHIGQQPQRHLAR